MSKYKSKQQLLDEITKEKTILQVLLNKLSDQQMTEKNVCGVWSVKDIIFHVAKWQDMVLVWYKEGSEGKSPKVPHEKYKWSQLPDLNNEIYETYKNLSIKEANDFFSHTEKDIMSLIEKTNETVLLKPGLQPWMNKNTLIAYLGSCTSSHYKWASGLIKKHFKAQ